MSAKNNMVPLSLLLVLTIMGCVGDSLPAQTGGGAPGIFVQEFASDQETIFPEEVTGINLKVSNGGEFVATHATATLFGLGELELNTPLTHPVTQNIIDLDPADPATGSPPDQREVLWYVGAPRGMIGSRGTSGYKIGVRIDYMYGSDGWAEMLVTEKSREKIKAQEGEVTTTAGGITRAPVETQVYAPKFLLYYEIDNSVNVRADLVNSGGGTSFCRDENGTKHLYYACDLQLTVPGDYLILDGTVGTVVGADRDVPENGDTWCCKPECVTNEGEQNYESDKEYFWVYNKDVGTNVITLTKSFLDPRTKESLELRGRGKYRSHVCWFKPDRDYIGLEEKIPLLASSTFGYSSKSELLLAVHGKEITPTR